MRSSLALAASVLALVGAAPASAQMCGSGQATGATASASGGGMMCGMGARPAATDPMAETRSPSQQSAQQGGCPCCRNMAMMRGGMGGGMGSGGAQRPSQEPSTPQSAPSMPGMPGMPEAPQTPRPQ